MLDNNGSKGTVAHILTENGLSVFYNGKVFAIEKSHACFRMAVDALREGRYDDLIGLLDVSETMRRWAGDLMTVENGLVKVEGQVFSEAVSEKVLSMIKNGAPPLPLAKFLQKLLKNPSYSARQEVLLFMVANEFMIHENGNIIAYKSVREDYTDIHSGTILNTVGTTNEMPRYEVDDRRNMTCSYGFHFAAWNYASTWAGSSIKHVMVMSIDPADVVSIPNDYNDQKGRCCKYTVIAERTDFQPLPEQEYYTNRDIGIDDEEDDEESHIAMDDMTTMDVWNEEDDEDEENDAA